MTIYQQTIGNLIKRSHAIGTLYDLIKYNRYTSEGQKRYYESELIAMGEGDYSAADHGEPPQGQTFK